jgi:hypothetical protein
MTYEIVSDITDLPSNSSYWLNDYTLKNKSNNIATVTAERVKLLKRKLMDENEENEMEPKTTLAKN